MKWEEKAKYYYERCQGYYKLWFDKKSLGMHYGFWENETRSRSEALINQYRMVLKTLQPKNNELILDAGCGVGGASFWLAHQTDANFIGITISPKQIRLAQKHARDRGLLERIKFHEMSFFDTNFKNETIDKIFTIESFCYSYPEPTKFAKEMYRILKRGGKIHISDGILLRQPKNEKEKRMLREWYSGWGLMGINTKDEIIYGFRKIGFKNINFIDKTEAIKKNVWQIYIFGFLGLNALRILRLFGKRKSIELDHARACMNQKKLVDIGLMGYGIFTAEK